ncbi:MAG: hypothetical protein HQL64_04210 [Magnetococcales bacterium]|nr:hypothetical protein [Magnetococcales bacterium]
MSDSLIVTLAARIDALSRREKWMTLGLLVLLPWVVANNFILRPLLMERSKITKETAVLSKSMIDLTEQRQRLQNHRMDAKKEEEVRLGEYRKNLALLESDAAKAMGKLVTPQEMTLALGALLRSASGITLTDLTTLPTQSIVINAKKDTAADPTQTSVAKVTLPTDAKQGKETSKPQKTNQSASSSQTNTKPGEGKSREEPPLVIWRHTLQLTFAGDYLSTMNLLQSLRGMPWTLYWDTLDIAVKEHPQAQVTLIVFTLSLQEELIGA